MILMDTLYTAEELNDVERDIHEAFAEEDRIPVDEHGFQTGEFRVRITWESE